MVETAALLDWAFVNDPVLWNRLASQLGTVFPDDLPYFMEDQDASDAEFEELARLRSLRFSAEAIAATRLAARLCERFPVANDANTVAFAATLIPGSFAQRWALQGATLPSAVEVMASTLFGMALPDLMSALEIGAPETNSIDEPAASTTRGRRPRIRIAGGLVVFVVLRFAVGADALLAITTAIGASIAFPEMFGRQTRSRLGLGEIGCLLAVVFATLAAATSIGTAISEGRAASHLAAAERSLNAGRPQDAIRDLQQIRRPVSAPREAIARACAEYAIGNPELALVYLQDSLLVGAAAPVTTRLGRCFLNSQRIESRLSYLKTNGGWAILLPTSRAATYWRTMATRAAKSGRDTDALADSSCAQHVAGNRLVAALDMTLAIGRGESLGNPLMSARTRLDGPARTCLNTLIESHEYDILRKGTSLLVRPTDYRARVQH